MLLLSFRRNVTIKLKYHPSNILFQIEISSTFFDPEYYDGHPIAVMFSRKLFFTFYAYYIIPMKYSWWSKQCTLKWYYDENIVYQISILSKSIFETSQNDILGFSIPHLVPETVRFLRYANEERMTSFTQKLNKIHKIRNISANNI